MAQKMSEVSKTRRNRVFAQDTSQLFPEVLSSCVSKHLIKDVTMTFPHIHKLRLCINIFLFVQCVNDSASLRRSSPGWTSLLSWSGTYKSPQQALKLWTTANHLSFKKKKKKKECKLGETQLYPYLNEKVSSPQTSFPCHPTLIHRLQILQSREGRSGGELLNGCIS